MADSDIKNQDAMADLSGLADKIEAHSAFCHRLGGSRVAAFADTRLAQIGRGTNQYLTSLALGSRELAIEVGLKYLPLGIDLHFLPWLDKFGGNLYPMPWRKGLYGDLLRLFADEEDTLAEAAWSSQAWAQPPARQAYRKPFSPWAQSRPVEQPPKAARETGTERPARRLSRLVERIEKTAKGVGFHAHDVAHSRAVERLPGPVAELVQKATERQPTLRQAAERWSAGAPAIPGQRPAPRPPMEGAVRPTTPPGRVTAGTFEEETTSARLPRFLTAQLQAQARSPYPAGMGRVATFARMIAARPAVLEPSWTASMRPQLLGTPAPERAGQALERPFEGGPTAIRPRMLERRLGELPSPARPMADRTPISLAADRSIIPDRLETSRPSMARPVYLDDVAIDAATLVSLSTSLIALADQTNKAADRLSAVMKPADASTALVRGIDRRLSGELLKSRPAVQEPTTAEDEIVRALAARIAEREGLVLSPDVVGKRPAQPTIRLAAGSSEAELEEWIGRLSSAGLDLPESSRIEREITSRYEAGLPRSTRGPRLMSALAETGVLLSGLTGFDPEPTAANSETRMALAQRQEQRRLEAVTGVPSAAHFALRQVTAGPAMDTTGAGVIPQPQVSARTLRLFSPAKALSLSLMLGRAPSQVVGTQTAVEQAPGPRWIAERASGLAEVLTEGRYALKDWEKTTPILQPRRAEITPFGRVILERSVGGTRAMLTPFVPTDSVVHLVSPREAGEETAARQPMSVGTGGMVQGRFERPTAARPVAAERVIPSIMSRPPRPVGIAAVQESTQGQLRAVRPPMDLLVSTHRPGTGTIREAQVAPGQGAVVLPQTLMNALRLVDGKMVQGPRRLSSIALVEAGDPSIEQATRRFAPAQAERMLVVRMPQGAERARREAEAGRLPSSDLASFVPMLATLSRGEEGRPEERPAKPGYGIPIAEMRQGILALPYEPGILRRRTQILAGLADETDRGSIFARPMAETPLMRVEAASRVMVSLADEWAASIPLRTGLAREALLTATGQVPPAMPAIRRVGVGAPVSPSRALTLERLTLQPKSSILGAAAAPLARIVEIGSGRAPARSFPPVDGGSRRASLAEVMAAVRELAPAGRLGQLLRSVAGLPATLTVEGREAARRQAPMADMEPRGLVASRLPVSVSEQEAERPSEAARRDLGRGGAMARWVDERLPAGGRPLNMGAWAAPFSSGDLFQLVSLVNETTSPTRVSEARPLEQRVERLTAQTRAMVAASTPKPAQTIVTAGRLAAAGERAASVMGARPALAAEGRPFGATVSMAPAPAVTGASRLTPEWRLLDLSDTRVQPFAHPESLQVDASRAIRTGEPRGIQLTVEKTPMSSRSWSRPFAALAPVLWGAPERALVQLAAPRLDMAQAAEGLPAQLQVGVQRPAALAEIARMVGRERPSVAIRELGTTTLPRAARLAMPAAAVAGGTWSGPMRVLQFATPVRPARLGARVAETAREGEAGFELTEAGRRFHRAAQTVTRGSGLPQAQVERELAREGLTPRGIQRAVTRMTGSVRYWAEEGMGFPALPQLPRRPMLPAVQRAIGGIASGETSGETGGSFPRFTLRGLDFGTMSGGRTTLPGGFEERYAAGPEGETSLLRQLRQAGMTEEAAGAGRQAMQVSTAGREMLASSGRGPELRRGFAVPAVHAAGAPSLAEVARPGTARHAAAARQLAARRGTGLAGDLGWLAALSTGIEEQSRREMRVRTPDLGWLRRELANIVHMGGSLPLDAALGQPMMPKALSMTRALLEILDLKKTREEGGRADMAVPQQSLTHVAGGGPRAAVQPARKRLSPPTLQQRSMVTRGQVQGQALADTPKLVSTGGPPRTAQPSIQPLASKSTGGAPVSRAEAGEKPESGGSKATELEAMAETILTHIRHRLSWERSRFGG